MITAKTKAALSQLDKAFKNSLGYLPGTTKSIAPAKAFELFVVAEIMRELKSADPNFSFDLARPKGTKFRMSHGPFEDSYQHILVKYKSHTVAKIVTDVEFVTRSSFIKHNAWVKPTARSDRHELDVLVISAGVVSGEYPTANEVFISAEAKYRAYGKNLLRELLGFRREQCFYQPNSDVLIGRVKIKMPYDSSSDNQSLLFGFCSQKSINHFSLTDNQFGIVMRHLPFKP